MQEVCTTLGSWCNWPLHNTTAIGTLTSSIDFALDPVAIPIDISLLATLCEVNPYHHQLNATKGDMSNVLATTMVLFVLRKEVESQIRAVRARDMGRRVCLMCSSDPLPSRYTFLGIVYPESC